MQSKRCSVLICMILFTIGILMGLGGCQTYVTPGRGAKLELLAKNRVSGEPPEGRWYDSSGGEAETEWRPCSKFPTHLAMVRVQESGYRSYSSESYGRGAFSVVTSRDVETDAHFDRIRRMAMVAGLAPLNRLLLPEHLQSDADLRAAARRLNADILLIYTFDTTFHIEDKEIGPLGVIMLGTLPNQQAKVTTTASGALFDVRTGFVYGLADATARESQMASIWSSDKAVEESRIAAERKSFELLLAELETTWKGVVEEYAVIR